jgi:hypothetical protein
MDPHELVKVDMDADDAMRRILAGGGMDEPVSDEAAEALYEPSDTGLLGGVDEANEDLDAFSGPEDGGDTLE